MKKHLRKIGAVSYTHLDVYKRQTVVFANTGVRLENVREQLSLADGAVVGTTFKKDGIFENHVDKQRVKAFMDEVKKFRKDANVC